MLSFAININKISIIIIAIIAIIAVVATVIIYIINKQKNEETEPRKLNWERKKNNERKSD